MKQKFSISLRALRILGVLFLAPQTLMSQAEYRNFPIIAGFNFQNLALPLQDMGSNFTHPGFFAGTEISLNKKHSLLQQAQVSFYSNKEAGNGIYLHSQFNYRQKFLKHFYSEMKIGLGWQHTFHPVDAYEFNDGDWTEGGGGKSQLIVPLGISLGYSNHSGKYLWSPFLSYQVLPALFYDDTIPLNFYSMIQLGFRVHLTKTNTL